MTDLKGELASLKIDRTRSGASPWRWPLFLLLPVVAVLLVLYGLRARQAFSAIEVETTTAAVSRNVEASAGTPIRRRCCSCCATRNLQAGLCSSRWDYTP